MPQSWKEAHITALHKKGSKKKAENYRPISLTAICCKVMESIIRDDIIEYMITNSLFADQQHGFVPNRSCMTQLICVMEDWTRWIDEGNNIDTVFLDFQKAFDSVPHERMMVKLEAYGITGEYKNWIRDFLKNRRQRVVVGKEKSEWEIVKSGIPQGSVLGPLMFVIFINDLPDAVSSTIKIFADDTKIYRKVNNDEDREILQNDINKLQEWAQTWQLHFNASKCKVMHKGYNNKYSNYNIDNKQLQKVSDEKDLGVTVDRELKFHKHVSQAVSKANQVLGIAKSMFSVLDKDTFPLVYKGQVRPHLEYRNIIWHPHYVADIIKVESVQRRATKLIPGFQDKTYEERLKELNLYSMEYRRKRGDMIQVYKILNQMDRIEPSTLFTMSQNTTRGHSKKIFKQRFEKELRKFTFSQRVVDDWNSLTEDIVSSESLNTFKSRLDKYWHTKWYKISATNV